jgi:hypothetical protein
VLFERPREALKYQELEGAHPRSVFGHDAPARAVMGNVIPNHARLFAEPREVLKYQEIDGAHAAAADLSPVLSVIPYHDKNRMVTPHKISLSEGT